MMEQRYVKQGFATVLLVGLVMTTLKVFLEPRSLEKSPDNLQGHSEYFTKYDLGTYESTKTSDIESRGLNNEPYHYSKKIATTLNKSSTLSKCGYDSCPRGKQGFLNVHLVPHSHDDLGFVNTMDQYYYGEGKVVGVVNVIDSIVEGLKDHPYRKFIFVEIAFFYRWWNAQNETGRQIVKNLVDNGQLEFVNGGWCINDEAVTHYVDIIDQMSLGSNFLNETFGECGRPKVGWQIDTFGHSKEHVTLLAQMGFDGIVLDRLHEKEKNERRKSKSMNFVWTGNHNFAVDGKLFTDVLFNTSAPPEYLCWKRDHFNETSANRFLDELKNHAQSYRTSHIMVPIGTEFRFLEEFTCFGPADKLIEHINKLQEAGSKVNVFYSTPSCYLKALNSQPNISWPSRTDDMFPYLTYGAYVDGYPEDQEYWTGFYTSRPAFKYMVRQGSNLLQSCKQMASYLSMKSESSIHNISVMKQAMGVMQHHDTITGTSKQFVIDDHIRTLHRGFEECYKIQNSFYQKELPKLNSLPNHQLSISYCSLNTSQCEVTEKSERVIVNVYNSLATFLDKYVRVPVLKRAYRVYDPSGNTISFDVIPIPEFVMTLPGRNSSATHELVFLALQVPPLGSKSYYLEVESKSKAVEVEKENAGSLIENERVVVELDEITGLMKSISVENQKLELVQEILWYAAREPKIRNNMTSRGSGHYMFRSNQTNPFHLKTPKRIPFSIYKGELVQEIHQHYNSWVGQIIRLYRGQVYVELDWVVGPINVTDNVGKEIVNRITTDLSSKNKFYTDANGRQILERRAGFHGDSFKVKINDHVGVLVDRAQGGSSLNEGQIEVMVHRRHVHKQSWLDEVLNETAYGVGLAVRGTHLLVLCNISKSAKLIRSLSHQMYKQPHISFISTNLSYQEWSTNFKMETKVINECLPVNVNLLTLDQRSDRTYLLRLEHLYGAGEDEELSNPIAINLRQSFFNGFYVTSAEETMLGGNQFKEDSKRLVWKESNEKKNMYLTTTNTNVNIENVILKPMQIRTFVVKIQKQL